MNRIRIYFITIIFTIIFLQLYWMYRSGGNLNVIVQNHALERLPFHLVIYLDEKMILNDTLTYVTGILSYNVYSTLGRHKFKINDMTNNKEYEWNVFLFPVTWFEINARSVNEIDLSQNFIPSTYQ